MAKYADASYWDQRYAKEDEPFEWYQNYAGMKHVLKTHVKPGSKVLVAGCGISALTVDLAEDCKCEVTAVDKSSVAIQWCEKTWGKAAPGGGHPHVKFVAMDAMNMSFEESTFDVVVDKAFLDTLCCGADADKNATRAVVELGRVLKANGVMIVLSHSPPEGRLGLFDLTQGLGKTAAAGMGMMLTPSKPVIQIQKPSLTLTIDESDKPKPSVPAAHSSRTLSSAEYYFCYIVSRGFAPKAS